MTFPSGAPCDRSVARNIRHCRVPHTHIWRSVSASASWKISLKSTRRSISLSLRLVRSTVPKSVAHLFDIFCCSSGRIHPRRRRHHHAKLTGGRSGSVSQKFRKRNPKKVYREFPSHLPTPPPSAAFLLPSCPPSVSAFQSRSRRGARISPESPLIRRRHEVGQKRQGNLKRTFSWANWS